MNSAISATIDHVDHISRCLSSAVEAGTVEERSSILALRRDQESAIDALYDAVARALSRAPMQIRQELEPGFQDRFQTMRRAILLHQGKWPAVLIASDPEGFLASARRARETKLDTIDWIRRELLPRL